MALLLPKEIVIFIDSPGYGGSEINAIKLIEFLHSSSFSIELVLSPTGCEELHTMAQKLGVKLTYLKNYSNKVKDIVKQFLLFRKNIKKYKHKICIVWDHHLDSNRWLQLYLALNRFEFFIVEQLLPTDYSILSNSKLTIPIKRFVSSKAKAVIICAYSQEKNYQQVFRTKNTVVVPNTRNIDELNRIIERTRLESKSVNSDFKIVCIARVDEQKDPETVIEAIDIVRTRCNVNLYWVGDGAMLEECKERINFLHLESYINFVGFDRTPVKWLALADLFILSSVSEGLPGALIEAMAAKLPCIATDIPGNNELIIQNETGLLIPIKSPQKLAEAIVELYNNKEERIRLSKNAFAHVNEKYNQNVEFQTWLNLLS
jgi:glycosyltransferase involved in cell wall biosynthesis